MKLGLLILASIICIVTAEDCPEGYKPYDATSLTNQTIEWTSCPVESEPTLECATIEVPLDWTDSSHGTLQLPVARVPANASTAVGKSIFLNFGGPGAPGIAGLIGQGTDLMINAGGIYHIVAFDPRGTGLTMPYECPDVPFTAEAQSPLNTARGLNGVYVQGMLQGYTCALPEYKDASELIGTAFVARDINALFEALQEDGLIRYWGFSYGTLLGATLAAMFPDKIDRMVLDGNINPTDYYHGLYDESADDSDDALLLFFETCSGAGEEYCSFAKYGSTGQDLLAVFYDFLDDLRNETYALTCGTGDLVSYKTFSQTLFSYLYNPLNWPTTATYLYTCYIEAVSPSGLTKRSFDPLTSISDEKKILWAVTCGDWDDVPGGLDDFDEWLALYEKRAKFGGEQMFEYLAFCSTWQANAREKFSGAFTDIQTKTPLLFVQNPYDPVTPRISAYNSSAGFVDSKVLEYTHGGHCTSSRSSCIVEKVKSYFVTGELPDVSQPCEPDFTDLEEFIAVAQALLNATEESTVAKRDVQDNKAEELVPFFRRSPETNNIHQALRAREEASTVTISGTAVLVPATCTPVSPAAATNTSTDDDPNLEVGQGEKSVQDTVITTPQIEKGVGDLKGICDGYSGDAWLFKLICGALR